MFQNLFKSPVDCSTLSGCLAVRLRMAKWSMDDGTSGFALVNGRFWVYCITLFLQVAIALWPIYWWSQNPGSTPRSGTFWRKMLICNGIETTCPRKLSRRSGIHLDCSESNCRCWQVTGDRVGTVRSLNIRFPMTFMFAFCHTVRSLQIVFYFQDPLPLTAIFVRTDSSR